MNIDVLRTIVAISEHGSFAAAARALRISQSAVTTHVQQLEADLGRQIFDRSKRPPVINESGMAAVNGAREIISRYDGLRSSARKPEDIHGRLQLGAVGSTLTGLLPRALSALRSYHPGIHVEVVTGFTDELTDLVGRRRLDAAIVSDYDGSQRDFRWRPFVRERLVMVAPTAAAGKDARRIAKAYPFIRYTPSAAVGRLIDRAIQHARLEIRETMRLDWIEAIEAMVRHGNGISIVPERHFNSGDTRTIHTLQFGSMPFHRTLGLLEPAKTSKSKLTDTVFSVLRELIPRQPD